MSEFRYIADISDECLENSAVIPCRNEQGYQTILIKNSAKRVVSTFYSTDNLSFKLDKVLSRGGQNYFFHIVESKKNDEISNKQFQVIYNYIFGKITAPISSTELYSLISSLEDYFRLSPDPNRKQIQIGVFGELLSLRFFWDGGYTKIIDKYHSNFSMKHDVEITPSVRVEIKTTVGDKRIHHFSHDQICRNDVEVYVVSVLLEPSEQGLSLFDLFSQVQNMTTDPDKKFGLQKLMVRCGVSESEEGPSFSEKLAFSRISIFKASSLPKIESDIPKGISSIEYDVDCSFANCLDAGTVIDYFSHLE